MMARLGLWEFSSAMANSHRGHGAARWLRMIAASVCPLGWVIPVLAGEERRPEDARADDESMIAAMATASGGYSVNGIVIGDELRQRFYAAIDPQWATQGNQWQRETLLRLVSLRKAGSSASQCRIAAAQPIRDWHRSRRSPPGRCWISIVLAPTRCCLTRTALRITQ